MKNTYGSAVTVTLFGESHGAMIGAVLGDVNPTTFLAISYTLLFGIMFGDLGQGLLRRRICAHAGNECGGFDFHVYSSFQAVFSFRRRVMRRMPFHRKWNRAVAGREQPSTASIYRGTFLIYTALFATSAKL